MAQCASRGRERRSLRRSARQFLHLVGPAAAGLLRVDRSPVDIVAPAADLVAAELDDPGVRRRDIDPVGRRIFVDAFNEEPVTVFRMVEDAPAYVADAGPEAID